MTFQMNRAAASIYLLIKLHAAFFAETPAFHMFFKSVFHYHPASIVFNMDVPALAESLRTLGVEW